jgi:3-dehydroquinate dehydratase II
MAKHILLLNGPNLNLLGKREPGIYGNESFESYLEASLKPAFPDWTLTYRQSNVEGELINYLHEFGFSATGIILNAGAYTHTSVAIGDAIAAIPCPVIEVHLSNVHSREAFRHHSLIARSCKGVISGFGMMSYALALEWFKAQPS